MLNTVQLRLASVKYLEYPAPVLRHCPSLVVPLRWDSTAVNMSGISYVSSARRGSYNLQTLLALELLRIQFLHNSELRLT